MNVYRDGPLLAALSNEELAALLAPLACPTPHPSPSASLLRYCAVCQAWAPSGSHDAGYCLGCLAPLTRMA